MDIGKGRDWGLAQCQSACPARARPWAPPRATPRPQTWRPRRKARSLKHTVCQNLKGQTDTGTRTVQEEASPGHGNGLRSTVTRKQEADRPRRARDAVPGDLVQTHLRAAGPAGPAEPSHDWVRTERAPSAWGVPGPSQATPTSAEAAEVRLTPHSQPEHLALPVCCAGAVWGGRARAVQGTPRQLKQQHRTRR